jgi:hypothetical protein
MVASVRHHSLANISNVYKLFLTSYNLIGKLIVIVNKTPILFNGSTVNPTIF